MIELIIIKEVPDMWDDPVVKEVREAGIRIQEKCHNGLKRFSKLITEGTEKLTGIRM